MTKALRELLEKRNRVAKQMHDLVNTAEAEDRGLSSDEEQTWNNLSDEITALDARVERMRRQDDIDADFEQRQGQPDGDLDSGHDDDHESRQREQHSEAFGALIRSVDPGLGGLTDEHRQIIRQTQIDARSLAAGSGSAGGYLVPEDFGGRVIDGMAAYGGIRNLATIITTADGAALPFPTNDDTGNSGALLAENTQDSEQDLVFGEIQLDAYFYTSRIIRVPYQLLQDSAFNLDEYIRRKFSERLGRATSAHYATGDGSSKPHGLMAAADVGETAAGTAAVTWDELLNLKHSVDPAYRQMNPAWVFNDTTFLAIKQLKDGDGRPLWQPNVAADVPATFDGDRYQIDQGVASMAADAKPVAYGDVSQYLIRDVMGVTMVRLVERYADYHQVGFIAFMRTDADLMDAGSGPVKVLQMASS